MVVMTHWSYSTQLAVVGVAIAAACGGKHDDPPTAAPPAASAPAAAAAAPAGPAPALAPPPPAAGGSCEVTIDGPAPQHAKGGGGPMAVGSDYWRSDAYFQNAFKAMGADAGQIATKMAADPKMYVLQLNCASGGLTLALAPAAGSKYADVPFSAKTYPVKSGFDAKPGDFTVMLSVHPADGGKTLRFEPTAPGSLEIQRFDATGITATLAYDAKSAAGPAKVTATFDFKCNGDKCGGG